MDDAVNQIDSQSNLSQLHPSFIWTEGKSLYRAIFWTDAHFELTHEMGHLKWSDKNGYGQDQTLVSEQQQIIILSKVYDFNLEMLKMV